MEKPKVSLILVYKNSSNTIKKCLDSILGQLFQSFELVCVNTGSTDGTDLIIEEYSDMDDRIKNIKIDEKTNEAFKENISELDRLSTNRFNKEIEKMIEEIGENRTSSILEEYNINRRS